MDAERAEQLDKLAVADRMGRMEPAGRGSKPRETDREMRFPAGAQEMIKMRGERNGFLPPIPESEQHADADAPETGGMTALGTGQAPVVVFLRSGRMQPRVGRTMVCLLVDDESLGARAN